MKKKIIGIFIVTLLIATSFSIITVADWDPEDGHKMHFPQLPDPNGWDVHATAPIELADDWHCTETGYVEDIHFWGSWLGDQKGVITSFIITIYDDIPADQSPTEYSMPGKELWSREVRDWVERGPYYGDQGWYWCEDDYYQWHDHQQYYQYNVFLAEPWLLQEYCNIYWLGISANVQQGTGTWGWKSSKDHWNDDAAWRVPGTQWIDMWEPEPPTTNQFWLTMHNGDPVDPSGGTDYYDDGTSFWGWYYYYYMGEPWWYNIWFYNAPFNYDKYKEIYVSFICEPISQDPVFFVINWATDIWSLEGVPGRPPLPGDVEGNPQLEDMYIGRWPSPVQPIQVEPGFNEFWLDIPWYNPEWVSIDFWGWGSFAITEGIITHHCLPPEHAESLDLAFVITGEPAEQPCVDIEKKVQNSAGNWVEEIDAKVCTNVEFKITVHNCGDPDLVNLRIMDTLPDCLNYVDGSSTVDGNPQEPSISGNKLTWTLPGPLKYCNTITIKFKAHVISIGENVNKAEVNADTPSGGSAYDYDTAVVNGIGTPKVEIEKLVSGDGGATWQDEIDAVVCTTLRFRIKVHNDGDYDLTNIKVVDILPPCLEYKDNATPFEPQIQGNKLTWVFPGPLNYCNSIIIEFDVHVISEGENINEATVTADSAGGSVTSTDTATVWAGGKPKPDLNCTGQLTWSRVKPGDTITTTIYVSNVGDAGSKLDWSVCGNPGWGTWTFTPSNGTDLTPATSPQSITVTVVAPNEKSKTFTGDVKLCNDEDSTDTCTIQVSLATPKNKRLANPFLLPLERLIERFPILEQMLQPIYDKLAGFY